MWRVLPHPRLVFTHSTPEFELQAAKAFPDAQFKASKHMPSAPTVYVAHSPSHVEEYTAWFPGVDVRARARLQHGGMPPGGGVYLPVSYNSWLMVIDGARGFGAAVEAARVLKDVSVVVCPAFESAEDTEAAFQSLGRTYGRWQDRIAPSEAKLVKDGGGSLEKLPPE